VSPAFEYVAVGTLDEALARIRQHGDDAKVLAGGQSLVPLLHYRLADPRVVVDINDLPLARIAGDNGRLRLGALVRHHQLEESDAIARRCPVLREAAALIGNVRVRALGTIGGSLAHADAAAELPMVTLALDGRFTLASTGGMRTVAARDFFVGPLTTVMRPDELLTEIDVEAPPATGWAIEEIARRAGDFALVAVTALVGLDRQGRVTRARLAFGGVAPTPVRAAAAEEALVGHEPTPERLARVATLARDGLNPQSDAFVSGAYRRHLAGVLARRALTRAVDRSEARERAGACERSEAGERAGACERSEARERAGACERSEARERAGAVAPGSPRVQMKLVINGRTREVDAPPDATLLAVLRDTLGIFDVKEGCDEGVCGACTVLLDARPVSSCLLLAAGVRGRPIMTVKGLEGPSGLHPLQEAFVRHGAVQCGFCTPGMLLTALVFLERNPRPRRDEIRRALEGNLCRCTGYTKIIDAIEAYAREDGRG